jgi:plasminogen activator inhibitor 1 RNA-binding protein
MSSANMFALLNDSGSDDEAPAKAPAAKAPAPARVEKPRPERKPRRNDAEPRPAREERNNAPYDGSDKVRDPAQDRQAGGKGDRRERSGKGKGKGSRGDSGREFPRRSGTGRGRENNRSGGGKYNWGKDGETPTEGAEGAEASAEGAAPAEAAEPFEEEVEEPTMSLAEYEQQQAEKSLNLNKSGERVIEAPDDAPLFDQSAKAVEDDYSCMFHDSTKNKKSHGKKGAKAGYKQADQILNMKFTDPNADSGKGGSKGKGERRSKGDGAKGGRSGAGKGGNAPAKPAIDLSNDSAFPTLGA